MPKKKKKGKSKTPAGLSKEQKKVFKEDPVALNEAAVDLGFVTREEAILNLLPVSQRNFIISEIEKKYDTGVYTDVMDAFRNQARLESTIDRAVSSALAKKGTPAGGISKGFPLINSSTSILGYEPAGSVLRKLYPNPFAVYSFIGNNHWATLLARSRFRCDVARDGWVLVAPEGVSKKLIKKAYVALNDLYVDDLLLNGSDMLNVYGNVWLDRDRNLLGGLRGIQILLPEKILPILDTYGDYVLGWEYIIGNKRFYFNLGEIDHLKTYNLRSLQLGNPQLTSVVVDVEADLYASIYANMMFQKGGLVRAIVSLGDTASQTDSGDVHALNPEVQLHFSQQVYEMFARQYSGVRGANQLTFLPNVKGVYPITNPKDLEGPYKETSDRTAIKVSQLLGVSPRRVGIHTTTQYENKQAVEDSEQLADDNWRYYITNIMFNYINSIVMRNYLEIDGVQMKYSGEYSSICLSAAEFGANIAQMSCNSITVDEFRTRILHWEALGGPDGAEFIGNVANKAALLKNAGNAASNKDLAKVEEYLQKAVGPKQRLYVNDYEGRKDLVVYHPRDIRFW